ncbi:hypothetical protein [Burkholderia pseudomallei]|uniref:hypothetical protein n=1 Tax=Burkholderia pseudomallei TaxID=28450 RepID=UPI0018DDB208|nr:hypothetical protein [Burkholderia pseudomallei]
MRVQRAPVRIETALRRTFDRGNAARFADEPTSRRAGGIGAGAGAGVAGMAASFGGRAAMQRSNAPRPCEDGRRSCAARLSIECPATHAALPGRRRAAHGRVRRRLAGHASRAPSGARVGAAKNFLATRVDSGGIRSS